MISLPPKEYASLPKLIAPAGYICVLRDIDRDVYRIDSTDYPAAYVDALLGELTGTYGIELLSILETDDIAASENLLYQRHNAALSDTWLELDAYQLRALRKSELRILDYSSQYVSRPFEAAGRASGSLSRRQERVSEKLHGASYSKRQSRPQPPSLLAYRYGARALRRHGAQQALVQPGAQEPVSWRQSLSDKFDDLLHNHPGKCIAFVLLVFLVLLIHLLRNPYPY